MSETTTTPRDNVLATFADNVLTVEQRVALLEQRIDDSQERLLKLLRFTQNLFTALANQAKPIGWHFVKVELHRPSTDDQARLTDKTIVLTQAGEDYQVNTLSAQMAGEESEPLTDEQPFATALREWAVPFFADGTREQLLLNVYEERSSSTLSPEALRVFQNLAQFQDVEALATLPGGGYEYLLDVLETTVQSLTPASKSIGKEHGEP